MVLSRLLATLCLPILAMPLTNCAAVYFNPVDPGGGPTNSAVLKSLRCEFVSFLTLNREFGRKASALRKLRRFDEAVVEFRHRTACPPRKRPQSTPISWSFSAPSADPLLLFECEPGD